MLKMKVKNLKIMPGSKGQMFLIAAIVIVASLVIIKFNTSYPSSSRTEEAVRARFENSIFENVVNELNETLVISQDIPVNITNNIFNFANFTESKMSGQSMTFKLLFVGAVANRTTNALNVSLINMLDSSINATLVLDGQSDFRSGVADYEKWNTSFTITPGTTYTLNVTYNFLASGNTTESISVKTKKGKDVYVGFFYVVLEGPDATHVGRYQKSVNL